MDISDFGLSLFRETLFPKPLAIKPNRDASFSNGMLRTSQGNWVTWNDALTSEQGAYPYPYPWIVQWTVPPYKEYYEENNIIIDL
jgi:hypothetical protein